MNYRLCKSTFITITKNNSIRYSSNLSNQIKELRTRTGAGLLDCRKALDAKDVNGDIDKAIAWLRAKGHAKAVSLASRDATEGVVVLCWGKTKKDDVILFELNSETDFVSRGKDFQTLAYKIANTIVEKQIKDDKLSVDDILKYTVHDSKQSINELLTDSIGSIRENIRIRRVLRLPQSNNGIIAGYCHGRVGIDIGPSNILMGRSLGVVSIDIDNTNSLSNEKSNKVEEMGKKLAMHIVASNPLYLDKTKVPQEFIDKESAIFKEQTEADSKGKKQTPETIAKIITGKINKRLGEVCLLAQNHVAEENQPNVTKFLESFSKSLGHNVTIKSFLKWDLGQN